MGSDFRVASVILPKISPSKRGKLWPIFKFYFLAFGGGGSSDLDGGEPGPGGSSDLGGWGGGSLGQTCKITSSSTMVLVPGVVFDFVSIRD